MTGPEDERPVPRPSPAAGAAARRARRIGGRPAPAPATTEAPVALAAPAVPADVAPPDLLDLPAKRGARPPKPAPTPPDEAGRPPQGVRSLPLAWFPAAVLAVAAVLLLVLLGIFSFRGYWAKPDASGGNAPTTQQQEQVLAAAKTCFARLNSYDYRKLDDDFADGLACTTGGFTTDYQDSFRTQVRPYAGAVKIVRVAQVNRAGITSINDDGTQWVVLVYGQLQITNTTTGKEPRIDPVGGVVTMDKVGSKWLVAKVDVDTGTGLSS